MRYRIKLWHVPGMSYSHTVTEDEEVTLSDGRKTKTVLEIYQSGTLHFIDDMGVEIYYNGTYFITSKEGHHEY